jgi:hypothetical protein
MYAQQAIIDLFLTLPKLDFHINVQLLVHHADDLYDKLLKN